MLPKNIYNYKYKSIPNRYCNNYNHNSHWTERYRNNINKFASSSLQLTILEEDIQISISLNQ